MLVLLSFVCYTLLNFYVAKSSGATFKLSHMVNEALVLRSQSWRCNVPPENVNRSFYDYITVTYMSFNLLDYCLKILL